MLIFFLFGDEATVKIPVRARKENIRVEIQSSVFFIFFHFHIFHIEIGL